MGKKRGKKKWIRRTNKFDHRQYYARTIHTTLSNIEISAIFIHIFFFILSFSFSLFFPLLFMSLLNFHFPSYKQWKFIFCSLRCARCRIYSHFCSFMCMLLYGLGVSILPSAKMEASFVNLGASDDSSSFRARTHKQQEVRWGNDDINLHFTNWLPCPCFRNTMFSPSSRRHVTRGVGWPVALHTKDASSPSCTAMSADDSSFMMSGGTAGMERRKSSN